MSRFSRFSAVLLAGALVLTPACASGMAYAGDAPGYAAAPSARPEVQVHEGYFTSTDGKGTQIYWKSQQVPNAKATVVVVHGAAEHSGRYDHVADRLLDAGYNVYRLDHRGHGKSAAPVMNNPVARGHIDDFHYLVDDVHQLVEKAKAENPGKTFMLGHSMGAEAAEFHGIKYPGTIDGYVTNGFGAPFNLSGSLERGQTITPDAITDTQRKLWPSLSEALPLDQMTTFNARLAAEAIPGRTDLRLPSPEGTDLIQPPNIFTNGVASDPAVASQYQTDPLVNKTVSLGMSQQLTFGAVYDAINADLFTAPTLIMHGDRDGLVPDYFSNDWYSAISSTDKQLIKWHGQMHEVFNEPAGDQAMDTVIQWLDARL
ncbi:alpha/beta fold hydrolase [Corynebacterium poyangense]|uniref:Alpha/beta fold hydrolase n=1 Tax=Corynebacterium poyangense TaxID=2684405 RepID=A0A7H0SRR8_9CORY|nr:alpha/beta hydrolase [Corynebacterium poyangense]MBZ8176677.1 alpha/beta fold hydrolase [Corynebacterium poyangense]QNQ91243.1 alpha/beta fold hydrolase [Corynebacterium poyangense]